MRLLCSGLIKLLMEAAILLALTGCGGSVVGPVQNYSENKSPEVVDFKSDLVVTTDLVPGAVVTLTVETTDPENDSLKYDFASDDGSFGSVSTEPGKATVEFIVGAGIVSGQTLTVTVSVSDGHLNAVKKTLIVGTAKDGPMISLVGVIPALMRPSGQRTFSFRASETGFYQIHVLPSGYSDSSIAWDSALPQRLYYVGETITVTVDGSGVGVSTASVKKDSSSNRIAVVFKNAMGDESHGSFVINEDSTAPILNITSPSELASGTGSYNSTGPFAVTFFSTDMDDSSGAGYGGVQLSYTTNGDDPDFSGHGTVVAMTEAGGSWSAGVTVGSTVKGSYVLKYIARDGFGNTGVVESVNFSIVTETVPPANVTGFTVTGKTDNTLTLQWTNPGDADYDHLEISMDQANRDGITLFTVGKVSETFTIEKLHDGTSYSLSVRTFDENGNYSEWYTLLPETTDTQVPGKPEITVMEITGSSVTFKIIPASDDDLQYTKYSMIDNYYVNAPVDGLVTFSDYSPGDTVSIYTKSVDYSGNESEPANINIVLPSSGSYSVADGNLHVISDSSGSDLVEMADKINSGEWNDHYFIVTSDIDMSGVTGFSPIGLYTLKPFSGEFNGGGHTISNLTISTSDVAGLFGYINGAIITGINFKDCSISGNNRVGTVAGSAEGSSISDCHISFTGSSGVSGGNNIGGIAGSLSGSDIANCSVAFSGGGGGMVYAANQYAGGIAGYVYSSSEISNCYFSGIVRSASHYAGGISGLLNSSSVQNGIVRNSTILGYNYIGGIVGKGDLSNIMTCRFDGSITGTENVGGICGSLTGMSNSNYLSIKECGFEGVIHIAAGSVSIGAVGGIVGYATYVNISNSYSTGTIDYVDSAASKNTGGIIGYTPGLYYDISFSYSAGMINAAGTNRGTMVGNDTSSVTNFGAFFDSRIVVGAEVWNIAPGTMKTTAEMKAAFGAMNDSFLMGSSWGIDPDSSINDGYPYLRVLKTLEENITP